MVAYVTKTMYNVDNIVQVYDYNNSDILDLAQEKKDANKIYVPISVQTKPKVNGYCR